MEQDFNPATWTVSDLKTKGKKGAAEYIRKHRRLDMLYELLDTILGPTVLLKDWDTIEWLKFLIAGGYTPDDFAAEIQKYDNSSMCGLVWTANFVAYRCRTCGVSPCMSICGECFHSGQHEGHDFNMFRSQAGGACDCGDISVMRRSGFCSRHGGPEGGENMSPPPELMYMTEMVMPRVFVGFLFHLRLHSIQGNSTLPADSQAVFGSETFMAMMNEISSMGAAVRKVLTNILTSREIYTNLVLYPPHPDKASTLVYTVSCKQFHDEALISLENPEPPPNFEHCRGLQKNLTPVTFLEELVFWNVKYEFPQKFVCFLLNMLPDAKYKEALTETFVMHYSRIAMVLERSIDPDTLSNRVVHVSVQLFSNEELAYRMSTKFSLLQVMVVSLKTMMSKILVRCVINDHVTNRHKVVDCSMSIMKEHCYWPLVSDLNNVLSHRSVAIEFMSNTLLVDTWFSFLSYFQGMNVNRRELTQHVEYEPNTYYAAFSAELEASAYPMWALLSHLTNESTIHLTKRVLESCLAAIQQWLRTVQMYDIDYDAESRISFHLPLHRYLSTFICQAVNVQKVPLEEVLPPENIMAKISVQPLRIQIAFYEIMNGLWVRNGLQIKGQAMTYIQCNFCSSMVDADLYLLQLCAMTIPKNQFMQNLIRMFGVTDWLHFNPKDSNNVIELESQVFEGFFQFLATLTSARTNLGISSMALTRLEMVTLLCMSDKTHSQLIEQMPERCNSGHVKDFDNTLTEVAEYKGPNFEIGGNMQQGLYVPKSCVWETYFDPIHVLLRAVYKRDFQNAMDRFTSHVRLTGKVDKFTVPWPPYRIPEHCSTPYTDPRVILNSHVFHTIVYFILYKAVYEKSVPDHVLSFLVYLLELALTVAPPVTADEYFNVPMTLSRTLNDLKNGTWFVCDCLSINLRTVISTVTNAGGSNDNGQAPSSSPTSTAEQRSSPSQVSHLSSGSTTNAASSSSPHNLPTADAIIEPHRLSRQVRYSSTNSRRTSRQNASNDEICNDLPSSSTSSSSSPVCTNPQQDTDTTSTEFNESIVSLLLKLQFQLSNKSSNAFDPYAISADELYDRIGDGAAFLKKVLIRITYLDDACRDEVINCKNKIWPNVPDEGEDEATLRAVKEKKRQLIVQRQKKLMEKYACMQREFLAKTKESDDTVMDWDKEHDADLKEYDCVICNQSSPSTESSLMGLIVLIQATSLLAHRRKNTNVTVLPTCDGEGNLSSENTFYSSFNKRIDQMMQEFDEAYWTPSVNLGWEGGVHVQTCGHHIHLECLKAYLKSTRTQPRQVPTEVEEYRCPLCRQLANSVLPVCPDFDDHFPSQFTISTSSSSSLTNNMAKDIAGVNKFLDMIECTDIDLLSKLAQSMKQSVEDMMNSTYAKFLQNCDPRYAKTLFLFATSVGRINLELEVIERTEPLLQGLTPKRSCILTLLHVLSFHCRTLVDWPILRLCWNQLTGALPDWLEVPMAEKRMPLLLRDPSALLLQFVFILPLGMNLNYFTCVLKLTYNLLFVQLLMQTIWNENEAERNYWRSLNLPVNTDSTENFTLDHAMKFTISALDYAHIFLEKGENYCASKPDKIHVESNIRELCLPFLRLASVVKYHIYNEPLPVISSEREEFETLADYLNMLKPDTDKSKNVDSLTVLDWPLKKLDIVQDWFHELFIYTNRSRIDASNFIADFHNTWLTPRLISLPNEYDKIFQHYHKRPCNSCLLVPQEPTICLTCGTLVCLKQNCCKRDKYCESIQHSIDCGAGTAVFLVVTSSYIVVIRGNRACFWGSVYLDSFGEEDRELKRGKPLYLSMERYTLLERQWLSHRFDHVNKKWIWHRDSL